ncbi:MAG: hypothetical protein V8K32_02895 [Candidatus Electrothrix gigas]
MKKRNAKKGVQLTYIISKTINHFFPNLFDRIRKIEDCRKKSEYELVELITACIAMFIFKEGSRNAFNNDRDEENFKENYKNLFHMRLPHMDTVDNVMRQLNENELEKLKTDMICNLLKKKSLHKFRFLGKFFIVAVDGTGIHSFSERHCDQCLTITSKNGKTTYFHNVLEAKLICSNGFSISLATEWIENPVGDFDKQDCEKKAFKRLAEKIKKSFPRLPICITADGLYPSQPFFNICRENDWHFIVTFKDGNLPSVWEKIHSLPKNVLTDTCNESDNHPNKKVTSVFRWINGIDYKGYNLNWVECTENTINIETNKTETVRFVHLTDIAVSEDNVSEISHTGRLRWKIENEGFNTQKNHGYNLHHKYSRISYTASKNYYQCLQIAHLINQLVELSEKFSRLLKGKMTVKHLWKCLIGFFTYDLIIAEDLSCILRKRNQIRFE